MNLFSVIPTQAGIRALLSVIPTKVGIHFFQENSPRHLTHEHPRGMSG